VEVAHSADEMVTSLRLTNERTSMLTCFLEPWGEQYEVPAETTIVAVAKGPVGGALDLVLCDDSITLYGWGGSVVTLYREDGRPLGPGEAGRPPVPLGNSSTLDDAS
jgi:hypothetical protein